MMSKPHKYIKLKRRYELSLLMAEDMKKAYGEDSKEYKLAINEAEMCQCKLIKFELSIGIR